MLICRFFTFLYGSFKCDQRHAPQKVNIFYSWLQIKDFGSVISARVAPSNKSSCKPENYKNNSEFSVLVTSLTSFSAELHLHIVLAHGFYCFYSTHFKWQNPDCKLDQSRSHTVWFQQIYTTTPFSLSLEMGLFVSPRVFVYHILPLCILYGEWWLKNKQ